MKKKQFPYKKVLEYRERIEDSKAQQLNKSQRSLSKELEKLNELKNTKDQSMIDSNDNDDMSIHGLKVFTDYIYQLNNFLNTQETVVEKQLETVEKDRKKLGDAFKEKKIIEKLKEKHKKEVHKAIRKKEMKLSDEKVNSLYFQKEMDE